MPVLFGRRGAREATEGGTASRSKDTVPRYRFFARLYHERATEAVGGVDAEEGGGVMMVRSQCKTVLKLWLRRVGCRWPSANTPLRRVSGWFLLVYGYLRARPRARNAYWPVCGSYSCASNTLSACRRCRMIASATLGALGKLPACCRPSSPRHPCSSNAR